MSTAAPRRPAFIPSLVYKDNRAALRWLRDAFGFEVSEVLTDSKDNIVHAEMTFGDGVIMIFPAAVWVARIVSDLTREISVALADHNRTKNDHGRIRLRLVAHRGDTLVHNGAWAQATGTAAAGKAYWERVAPRNTDCRQCHGGTGEGGFGPDLAGRGLNATQVLRAVRQPWGVMPAFKNQLTIRW